MATMTTTLKHSKSPIAKTKKKTMTASKGVPVRSQALTLSLLAILMLTPLTLGLTLGTSATPKDPRVAPGMDLRAPTILHSTSSSLSTLPSAPRPSTLLATHHSTQPGSTRLPSRSSSPRKSSWPKPRGPRGGKKADDDDEGVSQVDAISLKENGESLRKEFSKADGKIRTVGDKEEEPARRGGEGNRRVGVVRMKEEWKPIKEITDSDSWSRTKRRIETRPFRKARSARFEENGRIASKSSNSSPSSSSPSSSSIPSSHSSSMYIDSFSTLSSYSSSLFIPLASSSSPSSSSSSTPGHSNANGSSATLPPSQPTESSSSPQFALRSADLPPSSSHSSSFSSSSSSPSSISPSSSSPSLLLNSSSSSSFSNPSPSSSTSTSTSSSYPFASETSFPSSSSSSPSTPRTSSDPGSPTRRTFSHSKPSLDQQPSPSFLSPSYSTSRTPTSSPAFHSPPSSLISSPAPSSFNSGVPSTVVLPRSYPPSASKTRHPLSPSTSNDLDPSLTSTPPNSTLPPGPSRLPSIPPLSSLSSSISPLTRSLHLKGLGAQAAHGDKHFRNDEEGEEDDEDNDEVKDNKGSDDDEDDGDDDDDEDDDDDDDEEEDEEDDEDNDEVKDNKGSDDDEDDGDDDDDEDDDDDDDEEEDEDDQDGDEQEDDDGNDEYGDDVDSGCYNYGDGVCQSRESDRNDLANESKENGDRDDIGDDESDLHDGAEDESEDEDDSEDASNEGTDTEDDDDEGMEEEEEEEEKEEKEREAEHDGSGGSLMGKPTNADDIGQLRERERSQATHQDKIDLRGDRVLGKRNQGLVNTGGRVQELRNTTLQIGLDEKKRQNESAGGERGNEEESDREINHTSYETIEEKVTDNTEGEKRSEKVRLRREQGFLVREREGEEAKGESETGGDGKGGERERKEGPFRELEKGREVKRRPRERNRRNTEQAVTGDGIIPPLAAGHSGSLEEMNEEKTDEYGDTDSAMRKLKVSRRDEKEIGGVRGGEGGRGRGGEIGRFKDSEAKRASEAIGGGRMRKKRGLMDHEGGQARGPGRPEPGSVTDPQEEYDSRMMSPSHLEETSGSEERETEVEEMEEEEKRKKEKEEKEEGGVSDLVTEELEGKRNEEKVKVGVKGTEQEEEHETAIETSHSSRVEMSLLGTKREDEGEKNKRRREGSKWRRGKGDNGEEEHADEVKVKEGRHRDEEGTNNEEDEEEEEDLRRTYGEGGRRRVRKKKGERNEKNEEKIETVGSAVDADDRNSRGEEREERQTGGHREGETGRQRRRNHGRGSEEKEEEVEEEKRGRRVRTEKKWEEKERGDGKQKERRREGQSRVAKEEGKKGRKKERRRKDEEKDEEMRKTDEQGQNIEGKEGMRKKGERKEGRESEGMKRNEGKKRGRKGGGNDKEERRWGKDEKKKQEGRVKERRKERGSKKEEERERGRDRSQRKERDRKINGEGRKERGGKDDERKKSERSERKRSDKGGKGETERRKGGGRKEEEVGRMEGESRREGGKEVERSNKDEKEKRERGRGESLPQLSALQQRQKPDSVSSFNSSSSSSSPSFLPHTQLQEEKGEETGGERGEKADIEVKKEKEETKASGSKYSKFQGGEWPRDIKEGQERLKAEEGEDVEIMKVKWKGEKLISGKLTETPVSLTKQDSTKVTEGEDGSPTVDTEEAAAPVMMEAEEKWVKVGEKTGGGLEDAKSEETISGMRSTKADMKEGKINRERIDKMIIDGGRRVPDKILLAQDEKGGGGGKAGTKRGSLDKGEMTSEEKETGKRIEGKEGDKPWVSESSLKQKTDLWRTTKTGDAAVRSEAEEDKELGPSAGGFGSKKPKSKGDEERQQMIMEVSGHARLTAEDNNSWRSSPINTHSTENTNPQALLDAKAREGEEKQSHGEDKDLKTVRKESQGSLSMKESHEKKEKEKEAEEKVEGEKKYVITWREGVIRKNGKFEETGSVGLKDVREEPEVTNMPKTNKEKENEEFHKADRQRTTKVTSRMGNDEMVRGGQSEYTRIEEEKDRGEAARGEEEEREESGANMEIGKQTAKVKMEEIENGNDETKGGGSGINLDEDLEKGAKDEEQGQEGKEEKTKGVTEKANENVNTERGAKTRGMLVVKNVTGNKIAKGEWMEKKEAESNTEKNEEGKEENKVRENNVSRDEIRITAHIGHEEEEKEEEEELMTQGGEEYGEGREWKSRVGGGGGAGGGGNFVAEDKDGSPGHGLATLMTRAKNLTAEEHHNKMEEERGRTGDHRNEGAKEEEKEVRAMKKEREKEEEDEKEMKVGGGGEDDREETEVNKWGEKDESTERTRTRIEGNVDEQEKTNINEMARKIDDKAGEEGRRKTAKKEEDVEERRKVMREKVEKGEEEEEIPSVKTKGEERRGTLKEEERKEKERLKIDPTNPHSWLWAVETALEIEWPSKFAVAINGAVTAYSLSLLHPISRSLLSQATIYDPTRLNHKFEGLPANTSFGGRVEARVGRHHWPYPLLDFVFTTPTLLSSAEGAARKERGRQVSILSDLEVPGVAVTLRWSPAPFMVYIAAGNESSGATAHSSTSNASASTMTGSRSTPTMRLPSGYRLRVWHNAQIVQEIFASSSNRAKGCETTIGGLKLNLFYKVTIEAILGDWKSNEDENSPEGSTKVTPALSFNIDSGTLNVLGGGSTVDGVVECYSGLQVKCPSSERCVSPYWICDGAPDCPDGEDEKHCITTPCEGFRCWGDQCIPHAWRCDGEEDCMDGDDEYGCPACSPEEFRCPGGGQCLPANATCDGIPHCQDGWDESAAVCGWSPGGQCDPGQLQCGTSITGGASDRCVPSSWLCDGVEDCPRGEDEELSVCAVLRAVHDFGHSTNGTKKSGGTLESGNTRKDRISSSSKGVEKRKNGCTNREFTCRTDECIPRRWLCDGRQDCWDGKDETSTACKLAAAEFIRERSAGIGGADCADQEGHEYRCQVGRCIPRAWMCDGIRDCPTGDDEDATRCSSTSSSSSTSSLTSNICLGTDYRCLSGTCISVEKLCDRSVDCDDSDDEHERCDYLFPSSTVISQHPYHMTPLTTIVTSSPSLSSIPPNDTHTSSARDTTEFTTKTFGYSSNAFVDGLSATTFVNNSKENASSQHSSEADSSDRHNYKVLPDVADHSIFSAALSPETKLVEEDEMYIDFDVQIEGSSEGTTTVQTTSEDSETSMDYFDKARNNVHDRASFNITASWPTNQSAPTTRPPNYRATSYIKVQGNLQPHTQTGDGRFEKVNETHWAESFTPSNTSIGKNITRFLDFDYRLTEHGTKEIDSTAIPAPGKGEKSETSLEIKDQVWVKAHHLNYTSTAGIKLQGLDGPSQTLPPLVISSPKSQDKQFKSINEESLTNHSSASASKPSLSSQPPALHSSEPLDSQVNLSSSLVPSSNLSDHKHYEKQDLYLSTLSHKAVTQTANSSEISLHYVPLVRQEESILEVDNVTHKKSKISRPQEGIGLVFAHEYEKAEEKEKIEKEMIYGSSKKTYDGPQSSKPNGHMTEGSDKQFDIKISSPESEMKSKESSVKFTVRPLIDDSFEINDNEEDLGFSSRHRKKYPVVMPLESYSPGKEKLGAKSPTIKDKVVETYLDRLNKPHSQNSDKEVLTKPGKVPEDGEHDIYSEGYDGMQKLPIDLDIPEIDDGFPFIGGKHQKIDNDRKWEDNGEFFRGKGEVYQEDDKVIAENEITFRETGDSTLTLEEDDDYVQTKHRRRSGDAAATFYLEDEENGQPATALGSKGGRYYNHGSCRRYNSLHLAGLVLTVVFAVG